MTGPGLPEDPIGGRDVRPRGMCAPMVPIFRNSLPRQAVGDTAQPLLREHLTDPRKEP